MYRDKEKNTEHLLSTKHEAKFSGGNKDFEKNVLLSSKSSQLSGGNTYNTVHKRHTVKNWCLYFSPFYLFVCSINHIKLTLKVWQLSYIAGSLN